MNKVLALEWLKKKGLLPKPWSIWDTSYLQICDVKGVEVCDIRRFSKGDKVCVNGLDMAFVVECYLSDNLVKLFIEGESYETRHAIIHARPEVLMLNNKETLIQQGWLND